MSGPPARPEAAGEARARRAAGPGFVITGRRPAIEAVRSGRCLEIRVSEDARPTEGLRILISEAEHRGVPVRRVRAADIERLGLPEHQGVAASVAPPQPLDERALSSFGFASDALVVLLDGITDPQNFGACARSAEAAGAALLITRRRRSAPLSPAAVKASAGALLLLPVARVTNLTRTLGSLKARGFFAAGLDAAGLNIWDAPIGRPLVLAVGAEGAGLSQLVREACDVQVAIPLLGRVESLNASAALSVGLFSYALRPDRAATMPDDAGVAQSGSASDL